MAPLTCCSLSACLVRLACLLSCWLAGQPQPLGLTLGQTHASVCQLQLRQYKSLMVLRQRWGASPHSPLNQSWGTGKPPTIECPEDAQLPTPDHCSWRGVVCMGAAACINEAGPSQGIYSKFYYSPCDDGEWGVPTGCMCARVCMCVCACVVCAVSCVQPVSVSAASVYCVVAKYNQGPL